MTVFKVRTMKNFKKISTVTFLLTGVIMGSTAQAVNTEVANTANGSFALISNTTGSRNTATGDTALYSNTTGSGNSAYGDSALYTNSLGIENTATGGYALFLNTTGSNNTATGFESFYNNTTGYNSTANGFQALYKNTTGYQNAADGFQALFTNTIGINNVANGTKALYKNTTGKNNTADGFQALLTNTTGINNVAIGSGADVSKGNLTNATAIGYNAKVNASNKVRLGNTLVTKIEGQVPWSSTSDKRLKNHIIDLPLGLDFIIQLRPVEYIRNNDAEKTKEWGLIAQELQQTLTKTGYKDAGIVTEDTSPEKYMTVRYNDLLAPMIKATQEQQKLIEAQDKVIKGLLKRVEALEKK